MFQGTADQVLADIRRYADLGVTHFVFDPTTQGRAGSGFGGASAFASAAAAPSEQVSLAYAAVTPKGDLKDGLVTKAPKRTWKKEDAKAKKA